MEVEKELGFTNKRQIEEYGIDRFVEKCKERVLTLLGDPGGPVDPAGRVDALGRLVLHDVG